MLEHRIRAVSRLHEVGATLVIALFRQKRTDNVQIADLLCHLRIHIRDLEPFNARVNRTDFTARF